MTTPLWTVGFGPAYRRWFAPAFMAVMITATPSPAQYGPHSNRPLSADGSRAFRGILAAMGMEAVEVPLISPTDPEPNPELLAETIVILYGQPDRPSGSLLNGYDQVSTRVLRAGGAVLILAENPGPLDIYFPEPTDLWIDDGKVFSTRPADCYAGYDGCPFATARPTAVASLERLLGVTNRTATNHPAALRLAAPSRYVQSIIAGFPDACRLGRAGAKLMPDQGLMAYGMGREGEPQFRCLVISDQSIFMNQMVSASDPTGTGPQNLSFAYQVVRWLQGPTFRRRCMFIDQGWPRSHFDRLPTIPPPPIPPLPNPLDPEVQAKLTKAGNEALARLSDRDTFNRAIVGEPENRERFEGFLKLAGILAVIAVFIFGIFCGWRVRHNPDRGSAPDPGAIDEGTRAVIRELFAGQGVPVPANPSGWPPVEIVGPKSATLRRKIRTLWKMLCDKGGQSGVKPESVRALIVEVWAAAHDGRWRFAPPNPPAPTDETP